MKYLKCQYYVEVKDERYTSQPDEKFILREGKPSKSLRTQYQVIKETQIRRNHEVQKKRKQ